MTIHTHREDSERFWSLPLKVLIVEEEQNILKPLFGKRESNEAPLNMENNR